MTAQTITPALGATDLHASAQLRGATVAAARLARATAAVGVLGMATALFVLSRVFESWRIDAGDSTDTISLLGGRLSYPAANVGAIAVLVLALLGALVAATAILAAARELRAARRLAGRLGRAAAPVPRLGADTFVIEGDQPQAFCAGLGRPRVYITGAALEQLDEGALEAVLEHERQHARRRDPLRLAAGRVLARALFFLPWLRELTERERALAELSADETAAIDAGRPALARAMLAFEQSGGIDPARVERLLGEPGGECDPPAWRFPTALLIAGLAASALLAGVAALAAQFASGTATLALPFLSSRPCVTMLAILPAAVAFLGLRAAGRMRAGWLTASSRDSFQARRSGG